MSCFGENLRYYRCLRGMSQSFLSGKLYVSQQTVDKWERGLSFPQSDKIIDISDVLEISPADLLFDDNKITNTLRIDYTDEWIAMVDKLRHVSTEHPCRKNILKLRYAEERLQENNNRMIHCLPMTDKEMNLYISWRKQNEKADANFLEFYCSE